MNVDFDALLAEFGRAMGLQTLAWSPEGFCQLVFDGRHIVQLVQATGPTRLVLSCRLADYGVDPHHTQRMARANFLQAGCGMIWCVAPDGRPYLQQALDLEGLDAARVMQCIEGLLDQAERWVVAASDPAATGVMRDPAVFLQSV